ncbi:Swt1 family HEPN domain-containing protein [Actinocorallia sp. B10E7]|uniref:Swt1 family HEPN domain-containing protein n=1 Tax=Actinocorallia sp. B10E7 TaxID=3153558 RepID=UPI00325F5AFD
MAGNEERVGRGLELVGRGLRPYVDRQMANRHGPGWLEERSRRDSERLGKPVRHQLEDTRLLLTLLTEEAFFAEIIPPPGTELAAEVIGIGDRLGFRPFRDAEAAQALRVMAQLLRLVGARDLSAETQALLLPPKPAGTEPGPPVSAEKKAEKKRVPFGRKPKKAPTATGASKTPAKPAAKSSGRSLSVPQLRFAALLVGGLVLLALVQLYGPEDALDDPYEGVHADRPLGSELASYQNIELVKGFHLALLDDPGRPRKGAFRGDLFYTAGILTASDRRLAVLPPGDKGSYRVCRDTEPRGSELSAEEITKGRRFCVTTDKGAIGLFTVTGRVQKPEPAVRLDLTVWKGPRPE